jgi:glycosyltransferase involved in cell wall biosynthesis
MISIIIPVYNEEKQIKNLLSYLRKISTGKILEIIVVDGGSNDTTPQILASEEDLIFIRSCKGRAKQMNAGAAIAKAPVLYFLHADSYPPENFDSEGNLQRK